MSCQQTTHGQCEDIDVSTHHRQRAQTMAQQIIPHPPKY